MRPPAQAVVPDTGSVRRSASGTGPRTSLDAMPRQTAVCRTRIRAGWLPGCSEPMARTGPTEPSDGGRQTHAHFHARAVTRRDGETDLRELPTRRYALILPLTSKSGPIVSPTALIRTVMMLSQLTTGDRAHRQDLGRPAHGAAPGRRERPPRRNSAALVGGGRSQGDPKADCLGAVGRAALGDLSVESGKLAVVEPDRDLRESCSLPPDVNHLVCALRRGRLDRFAERSMTGARPLTTMPAKGGWMMLHRGRWAGLRRGR